MKIKKIEITNIKGIGHKAFDLDLIPNKPNILVAPNGFGKSSFCIGFDSLKRSKIELDDKNYHQDNSANRPILSLVVEDASGVRTLTANDTTNTILSEFDIFVINSQLMAKATKMNIGGTVIVKSSLEISPTVLVPTIPPKTDFNYSPSKLKKGFGANGKILPNISNAFRCAPLLWDISNQVDFSKFGQVKISNQLKKIKFEINAQTGNSESIKLWIEANKKADLEAIMEFKKLASILRKFDEIKSDVDSFLAAFQIIDVVQKMGANFKKAVNYLCYLDDKAYYEKTIADFNTTRHSIRPKEDKKHNSLIVDWPKAHEISNGQRDVLSFITLLMKAKRNFKQQNCVLIIDEVFDYLDDANLISFQYFITTMIEEMKKVGKNFFPILMTHLDPLYFNHFCFNRHKIKVVYLKDVPYHSNPNLVKLIKKREDTSIKANVDKYHFHYEPTSINISTEFTALGLPATWGDSINFHQFIEGEVTKYLNDQTDYDPLAICFGVRVRIEKLIYQQITDPAKQAAFLAEHGTKKKLEYCETIGHSVPEIYYLLGIIYNDSLHWREGIDNVRPVAIKLENLTIKNLIREIFK
ncbi:hypothetical protein [Schleiferia thermophila]|jgi:hypothetical protein